MSMMDAGASSATSIANTLLQLTITILRDLVKFAVRTSGRLSNGALHAAGALLRNAQARADRGQVGLSRFTQLAQSREPVHVTDREVAKILRAELKKHGVTFAVEKHLDGSMTYHAEGKDATIMAHALEQAEKRVDELNQSRAEALDRGEAIPAGDDHHTVELDQAQATQLAGELREYGQTLHESGRVEEAAAAEKLAAQVEKNQAIPADAESLELVDEARAAQGTTPEAMQPVQEAIDDEKATIAAESYHAMVGPSIAPEQVQTEVQVIMPMNEAQAQQLTAALREHAQTEPEQATSLESLAEGIEANQSIELTPENTEILHATFEQQGWRTGTKGDQTPRPMRDVVDVVEEERTVQQQAPTVDVERAAPNQEQAAPIVDALTQTTPSGAEHNAGADPFGADEWGDEDHELDAAAPEITGQAIEHEAPSTTRERESVGAAGKQQRPALGQVVGKIVQARTETAKKDAAARQAQRDAGLTPDPQTPTPTGPTR